MPHLGTTELIIILVIVIAIFGAGKLASLGGALGKGVRDFRAAMGDHAKGADGEDGSAEPKAAKVTEPTTTPREGSDQGA